MRLILIFLEILLPTSVLACGAQSDCDLGNRSYRIAVPEGVENPGVLVFAHGYGGTSSGTMRNQALTQFAFENEMALLALHGVDGNWQLPGTPRDRDHPINVEVDYAEAVLADAVGRFGIDLSRTFMSGFSSGGMMTWHMICYGAEMFAGFIPMSGTLWTPEPTACTAPPANVTHIHGSTDTVVPLTGRVIDNGKQGNVSVMLEMYTNYGGFDGDEQSSIEDLTCTTARNAQQKTLTFCAFEGGHGFSIARLRTGLEMVK